MRFFDFSLAITLGSALVCAESRTATIFVQPVTPTEARPSLLAEISYDFIEGSEAIVLKYEAPELPDEAHLVRVGVYDPAVSEWLSSTSVASVDNFGKGYSPHLTVTTDVDGRYLGASFKGVGIDAGETRDFGPQVNVVVTEHGKQPDLNKPVVLSPEGKKIVPEEKTFLQKYWWMLAIAFILFSAGGGDQK
ncbi:hypothetical protein VTK73DRAFT_10081 [Phialemonium thermophilum]|uniref:Cyclin-dependent protein kinase regulator pho80 n=1 Tax=Phialemonium thermophilum TaxID=223376 RepID=A0ABR3XHZ9_9PEZI